MSLKKNLEQEIKRYPDYEVFFFDEARFGTHSRIGHGWFKTGQRTPVKKKLGFKNFYIYTAASPKTGSDFSILAPNVNTEWMNTFLQEMSLWLNGKKVCIIMDQAGWHRANDIILPDNIIIIYLPPYSPELNPVEKLWQYIKDNVLKNVVYETLKDLEEVVCGFINKLCASTIKSVCNVSYMSYYL
jgi:transposase